MDTADIVVVALVAVLVVALGWFFFGPRHVRTALIEGGVQRVEVTVRGGYIPDVIRVRQGVPLELVFDRQEGGECTNRVVLPDLRVSAGLPGYQRSTVRLRPERAGSFGFACGMNMIHGTLVVDPGEGSSGGEALAAADDTAPDDRTSAADAEAAEVAERRAEIGDLGRRVASARQSRCPCCSR
ncbi:cupredoxin domain-containing protein [Streptomyces sp. NBC_01092]|nr:cupredoxin domain-containing protein [Streptomyces sp. NBC_01092]